MIQLSPSRKRVDPALATNVVSDDLLVLLKGGSGDVLKVLADQRFLLGHANLAPIQNPPCRFIS